jgi:hypothetical protein
LESGILKRNESSRDPAPSLADSKNTHCRSPRASIRNWLRVIRTYETKPLICWGDGSTLKTKTQQSNEIAGFLVSILVAGTRNHLKFLFEAAA